VRTEAPDLVQAYAQNMEAHAVHSHAYRRRQGCAGVPGGSPPPEARAAVRGNTPSQIYHLPDCPGYTGLSAATRRTVPSEEAAQQAGYRQAKHGP
jgi:hypothetical protein